MKVIEVAVDDDWLSPSPKIVFDKRKKNPWKILLLKL